MSKNRAVRLGDIVEKRQRAYNELLAELQGEREREAHRQQLEQAADNRKIRTFYLRVMQDDDRYKGVAIAEVIDGGEIARTWGLYCGRMSWRDLYRNYSNWILDKLDDGQMAQVQTNDLLATNRKTQRYERLEYIRNNALHNHSILNDICTKALTNKYDIEEYETNEYKNEQ